MSRTDLRKTSIKYHLAAVILLFATTINLEGQNRVTSPYSRFGVGDLSQSSNSYFLSMGGATIGARSARYINVTNPASYTAFAAQSFVFQGGVYNRYANLKTEEMSETGNYTSLGNLVFGFPVTKWWKASFGLLPYSNVGYNVNNTRFVENVGDALYRYEGSGGLSRFYIGSAFQLGKHFSVGANASYMFGNTDRTNSVFFPDSLFMISSRRVRSVNIQDVYFEYGLQYHNAWENDLYVDVGATFQNSWDLHAEESVIGETFLGDPEESISIVKDTVNTHTTEGSVTLPMKYGIGVVVGKRNRWLIGMDYETQQWEDYKGFGEADSLVNSSRLSVGAEITPDATSISSYWSRMRYRLGFRYYNSYLNLNDNQINEFGISFGIGLPIRGSNTMVNLGAEVGKRGTTADNLIEENFIRLSLGLSIQELWFVKRKYN
ncbi:MAG: hypothetical protein K9I94_06120 [Bacteroidales bacterium]|nr:hypothetical protein [Bacteroidales bacterium]